MANCLVLGFFDGIHSAHKEVILSATKYKKYNHKIVMVTFKESPSLYFKGTSEYIMQREESFVKAKNLGVDEIIVLDFEKVVNLTAEQYLEYLIKEFSPYSISTGYNHSFGYNRAGNPDFLKTHSEIYKYKYICIPPYKIQNNIVSSSAIRDYLKNGKIIQANEMLESNFSIEGKVIQGEQLGRTIGFPTANIIYPENIVKLPYGVYKTRVTINRDTSQTFNAITNWGIKPTVNKKREPIVEVHLLNYQGDLYEQKIKIEFFDKIRDEKKFADINELKGQIQRDIECLEL